MKNVLIDLTGQTFGKLKVLGIAVRAGRNSRGHATPTKWQCLCDCGKESVVAGKDLRNGRTRSCGCLRADSMRASFRTHGEGSYKFYTPEYSAWQSMRGRCLNPNNTKYYCYGARGIKVCERWNSYENFLQDMGRKPDKRYSLDRINVNGDYEPSNCRWLDPEGQYWNRQGSLAELFIAVARNTLPDEMFNALWLEALKLQEERIACPT